MAVVHGLPETELAPDRSQRRFASTLLHLQQGTSEGHPSPLAVAVLVLAAVQLAVHAVLPWFFGASEVHAFRDDAYYQFVVARNLANGLGFTFDGAHAAGGVQLVWTLLLALPSLVLPAAAIPTVAVALWLGLHFLSGLLVLRLVDLFAPRVVAVGLAALFLSRPTLVLEAINGQETALALFCLLIWVRRATEFELERRTSVVGLFVWTTVLPWVRTDLLVFPAAFVAWGLLARCIGGARRPFGAQELAFVVSFGVYVFGQWLCFGHPLPASGLAVPWLFHDAFAATNPSAEQVARQYWWFVRPVLLGGPYAVAGLGFGIAGAWWLLGPLAWRRGMLPLMFVGGALLLGAADLTAAFFGAVLLVFTRGVSRTIWLERIGRPLGGLWFGFVLLLVLHLPLRWYPRDYYFVPVAVCGVVTLALAAGLWLGTGLFVSIVPMVRRVALFHVGLIVVMAADLGIEFRRFPWQAEMKFAAQQVHRFTGDAAMIGAFNAGLLAWFYPGPVRNLDGATDGACIEALRGRWLVAWMREEGVEFVVDTPRQLAVDDPDPHYPHASGRYLGEKLVPLLAFDLRGVGGRHKGTECQMLWALPGVLAPKIADADRIVEKVDQGVVLLLRSRVRWTLFANGVERPLRIPESAQVAAWLLTRLDVASGELRGGDGTRLAW